MPDGSARRRWGDLNDILTNYPLKKTIAYRLLSEGKLRAKKLGGKTIWDLASADEYFASLPDYEQAA